MSSALMAGLYSVILAWQWPVYPVPTGCPLHWLIRADNSECVFMLAGEAF